MRNVRTTKVNNIEDVNRELERIYKLLQGLPIIFGNGSPENNEMAKIGTVYLRLDGGTSTTLYVKESGDKTSSGWIAK